MTMNVPITPPHRSRWRSTFLTTKALSRASLREGTIQVALVSTDFLYAGFFRVPRAKPGMESRASQRPQRSEPYSPDEKSGAMNSSFRRKPGDGTHEFVVHHVAAVPLVHHDELAVGPDLMEFPGSLQRRAHVQSPVNEHAGISAIRSIPPSTHVAGESGMFPVVDRQALANTSRNTGSS